jgi:hypothetical protein
MKLHQQAHEFEVIDSGGLDVSAGSVGMRLRKPQAHACRWRPMATRLSPRRPPAAIRSSALATSAALTRFAWISRSPNRIRALITSSSNSLIVLVVEPLESRGIGGVQPE